MATSARHKNTMEGFVELVASMNPYTSGKVDDMDLFIGYPTEGTDAPDPSQIEMELDGDYPGEWTFKGQPQKINRVMRIKYRCKAKYKGARASGDDYYWMTAYLLIGFEDGGP